MKRLLALLALLGIAGAALAADNATLITPCGTGCVTVRAKDVGLGVQSPVYILGDTSGNPIYGSAGTANANVLTVQGIASMTKLLVDGSGVTQPVSGTVTVQQGTAANLNATVTGTVAATESGTWTVQQGTPPWIIQGDSASGASNAGNPVKAGGVFNTTQPTVTTGETVDAQYTARGAAIVATGVDSFTVGGTVTANQGGTWTVQQGTPPWTVSQATASNLNATVVGTGTFAVQAAQSGTWTVQQGGAPWSGNITQFGGVALSTGTGASGTGIPRVTVSNDSNILATQSGTWTVQQGGAPWSVNETQIAGSAISTAATGVQKVGITGSSAAAMDAAGQNASSPANELLTACQFNTSPTTITSGNVSPVQCDSGARLLVDGSQVTQPISGTVTANAGTGTFTVSGTVTANQGGTWTVQPGNTQNTTPWLTSIVGGGNTASVNASNQLAVNCANCSGSGVSQQDATGFTYGSGNMVPVGGVYSTQNSPLTSGSAGVAQLTANRALQVSRFDSAGQELGGNLPGHNNVPIQINQAQQFTQYNKTVFPTAVDAYGNQRMASLIYDGQHYANVVASNGIPQVTDPALEVAVSPKISLQCPYVVGINQTSPTQIVTNPGTKSLHICTFNPISASAQNVSLVEGTGSTCGTGTVGLWGGTTASVAVAANGGAALVSDRVLLPMQKPGDNLCVLQSASGNVSGTLTYGIF